MPSDDDSKEKIQFLKEIPNDAEIPDDFSK